MDQTNKNKKKPERPRKKGKKKKKTVQKYITQYMPLRRMEVEE